ncbi:sigma-54 interaction domain-containing protein [Desulfoferrobacter suflitae]|uniref:sigma-54 interaction domain-containing protein n=1 Tax=Desulfoferrobacter suflitae TaxID=2865782 RepID=UPI002164CD1B|nr:sigma 54-interacting transcriptional regulator [Desulfoferrobacter suflitae]MCK8603717.1 sigma 54-interacting transcriptional regulator [Desulfoferrobacter suflitae]
METKQPPRNCSEMHREILCNDREKASACCVILESVNDGVFAVGRDQRIIGFFNRAAEQITGFSSEEAIGRYCFDVFRADICQTHCPLRQTMATGEPVYDQPAVIINRSGSEVSVSISTALLRDDEGQVLGMVEVFRDLSLIETLRTAVSEKYRLGDLIGKSAPMQKLFEILPDVAESDSTVLIQGPSGSGKELVARLIHELSPRKDQPLVKINCGAIPDTLLESELFGYVKGAFTDARKDKPGRFLLGNRGTVFLDEIGDTSPALQVKLLRVLEEKQFVPLGGTTPIKVDVRIVAASHKDIRQLMDAGSFRDDLYYRLNIIKLELTPLCERKEDIPMLVDRLLARLGSIKGKRVSGVTEEVMELLLNYQFPGNVRELENILEHAYVLCKGPLIKTKHLPQEFLDKAKRPVDASFPVNPLESSEARTIRQILATHNGCKIAAARELGVSRTTLWRKIKKLHIDSP